MRQSLVRPEGLEPPTVRVEAGNSIQLSYGRCDATEYDLQTSRCMVGAT